MPYEFTQLRDERGDALSRDRRDGKLRFEFLEHASPSLGRQEINLGRCDEHRFFQELFAEVVQFLSEDPKVVLRSRTRCVDEHE